jgi:hypothetical protein
VNGVNGVVRPAAMLPVLAVQRKSQERPVPQGNINGKWKHDLHEDSGPAQPRCATVTSVVAICMRSRMCTGLCACRRMEQRRSMGSASPEIHRRVLVENVPASVTKEDMVDLVGAAGCAPVSNVLSLPNMVSRHVRCAGARKTSRT